jgi:hypothetical protein
MGVAAVVVCASACGSYPSDDEVRAKAAALCKDWREGHLDAAYQQTAPEMKKAATLEAWNGVFEVRANVSGACVDVASVDGTSRGVGAGVGRYVEINGSMRYERGEAPFRLQYSKCDRGWCLFNIHLAGEPKDVNPDEVGPRAREVAEKLVKGDKEGLWASFSPLLQKNLTKEGMATHVDAVAHACGNATLSTPEVERTNADEKDAAPRFKTTIAFACPDGAQKLQLSWEWALNTWVLVGYQFQP